MGKRLREVLCWFVISVTYLSFQQFDLCKTGLKESEAKDILKLVETGYFDNTIDTPRTSVASGGHN